MENTARIPICNETTVQWILFIEPWTTEYILIPGISYVVELEGKDEPPQFQSWGIHPDNRLVLYANNSDDARVYRDEIDLDSEEARIRFPDQFV